jgi:phosphatidyl-myo-inositol dimannoside synthase
MSLRRHLFVVNDFPPILGGQSSYLENLCRALPPEDILVLAPCVKGDVLVDRTLHFTVVRRPYLIPVPFLEKPFKILGSLFWTAMIMVRVRPRFLHCAHVLSTGLVGLVLNKICRVPYIVYTHSADILEYRHTFGVSLLLKMVLKGAFRVAANSRFTAGHLQEMGVLKENILIIPPRIDPGSFDPVKESECCLASYDLSGRRVILSVNRLVARKGNDTVLLAMPDILEKYPDACYVVVGHGPEESRLKKMAQALGIEKSVLFVTKNSDAEKKAFFRRCDLFVMISKDIPSRGDYEGFGVVYLEAGACRKPVVAGDSGGVRDAVIDGHTGLLIKPDDVNIAKEAILKLLNDRELSARLGMNGYERVRREFNAQRPVDEMKFLFT